eukprot:724968_1
MNILHRLTYITQILVDGITGIEECPSLVDIRVPPNQRKEYDASAKSFIFSDYDKVTHLRYVERELDKIKTYKPASKQIKGKDPKEYEKYRDVLGPMVADLELAIQTDWPKKTKQTQMELTQLNAEKSPLL